MALELLGSQSNLDGNVNENLLVFASSIKRETGKFHVVQERQRNVLESLLHVQSCCFANLRLLLFRHSRCHRSCLSSLLVVVEVA